MDIAAMDLEGPSLAPLSCGKAVYLVVLLHGLGANGNDLIDMALNWQPMIPKAEFLAMNAPFPFDGGPFGRQWFSVEDRSPDKVLPQLRVAAEILNAFLDSLLEKRRLSDSHLALVGFSQGAMMALHVGLRRKSQIGGIVGFSGSLLGDHLLESELTSKPPVLLVHGDADAVVPYESMGQAKTALKTHHVPVKSLTRKGLGHSIDDDSVMAAGDFLLDVLVPKKKDAHDDHDHDHDH
jgi:phospholipase/carboxylesterase